MSHYKTLPIRWLLPLLFFFLLIHLSKANAIIIDVSVGNDSSTVINKTWSPSTELASTILDIAGITADQRGSSLKIISNNNDKAFAVWMQYDSIGSTDTGSQTDRMRMKYALWSAYFDGRNWNSPMKIKGVNPTEKTTVPEIIFDDNGDVLATWTESTRINHYRFTSQIVLASRFDSRNLDWNYPTQLTYEDLAIRSLKIASRNNGIIHVIWEQQSTNLDGALLGSNVSSWSSVFNGSSWNNPTKIYETLTFEEYKTKKNPVFSN